MCTNEVIPGFPSRGIVLFSISLHNLAQSTPILLFFPPLLVLTLDRIYVQPVRHPKGKLQPRPKGRGRTVVSMYGYGQFHDLQIWISR